MIRGRCPTVHRPMLSGDGLLARVKPFGGRLSAEAVRELAAASAAYGNGVIELTSRGNLQVRGLHDPGAFARAMVVVGLADPDPVREARRNVVTAPPCDDGLAAAVEALMSETPHLPEKLCVLIVGRELWIGDRLLEDATALRSYLAEGIKAPSPLEAEGRGEGSSANNAASWCPTHPSPNPPLQGRGTDFANGHLLYLPFGQTTAAQLATVTTALRTTPWRAFLSPIPVPGFATAPSSVTACAGAPACASGSVPARADAAKLQARGIAGVHLSGCAKGCGRPSGGTNLVGRAGRYDLVRLGQVLATGLTLDQAAAAL